MKQKRKYTFRHKIFCGMLLVAIIPMLIGYILMLQVFHISYRKNFNEEAEATLSAAEGALEFAFSHVYEGMNELSDNDIIKSYFSEQGDDYTYQAFRQLYAINSQHCAYATFSLYDKEGIKKNSVINNQYIKDKLPLDWGVLYEATKNPGSCIVRNARIYDGEDKEEYLRAAVTILNDDQEVLGYVVATVLKENFDEMLLGVGIEKQGVIYADDDYYETVYYSSKTYDEKEFRIIRNHMMDLPADSKTGLKSYYNSNMTYCYYEYYVETCLLHIYYQQPVASLNAMRHNIMTIAVVSGLLTLLFCLMLSGYFSNYFYRPIKRIQEAIAEIKKGNYQVKIAVDSDDELGELSDRFNRMSEALETNMNQLVLRERELSETQIHLMQAQLNPHFLYNTLDTMKWIGKANRIPEVVTLSTGLAQILRMSISSGQMIHLSEELSLVEAYVEIQKIRFSDKFEFMIDVPEALQCCLVPKLILQPMVENSILHGFAESEHGTVFIQGYETKEQQLMLQIIDDGKGMSEKELSRVNHSLSGFADGEDDDEESREKSKRNIGIYNVNAVIGLRFGRQYGVHVESEEGRGTTITIMLPLRKEETDV